MSFRGSAPYGTEGGTENPTLPQSPDDVRIAVGSTHITFLLVNGPLTLRNRSDIENVIRTIGARGEVTVALIIQENGATVDNQVTQIDIQDGLDITSVSPGIVAIRIPTAGITAVMLANAIIDATKLAANSVNASHIVDGAVGSAELASGAVLTSRIADANVTPPKLDRAYVEESYVLDPIFSQSQNAVSNISATTQLQAIQFNLPAGTYRGYIIALLHAEGSGVTSDGFLQLTREGAEVSAMATRFESGVNATTVAIWADLFTLSAADTTHTFSSVWVRTNGTINIVGRQMLGILTRIS